MFTANLTDGTTTIPRYHAGTELANLKLAEKPIPAEFPNANSIRVPRGEEAAHAWVLCNRDELVSLNLNALQALTFAYSDEKTKAVEMRLFNANVVCKV